MDKRLQLFRLDSFCGDAFIAKLNATGSRLLYSTFLGGSGDDGAIGIAVDKEGNSYVVGVIDSPDFPTRHALQPALSGGVGGVDAFVVKVRKSPKDSDAEDREKDRGAEGDD